MSKVYLQCLCWNPVQIHVNSISGTFNKLFPSCLILHYFQCCFPVLQFSHFGSILQPFLLTCTLTTFAGRWCSTGYNLGMVPGYYSLGSPSTHMPWNTAKKQGLGWASASQSASGFYPHCLLDLGGKGELEGNVQGRQNSPTPLVEKEGGGAIRWVLSFGLLSLFPLPKKC